MQKQPQKFQYHYSINAIFFGNSVEVERANRSNWIFAVYLYCSDNLGQSFSRFSQIYEQFLLTTRKRIRLLSPEAACARRASKLLKLNILGNEELQQISKMFGTKDKC